MVKFDLPFDLKWPKIGHFGQFYIVYCTVLAFTTHFLYNVIQYDCPTIVTQILISGSKVKVILRSKRSKNFFRLFFVLINSLCSKCVLTQILPFLEVKDVGQGNFKVILRRGRRPLQIK